MSGVPLATRLVALGRAVERVQHAIGLPPGLAQIRPASEDAPEPSWSI